jgi:hypothetical protein
LVLVSARPLVALRAQAWQPLLIAARPEMSLVQAQAEPRAQWLAEPWAQLADLSAWPQALLLAAL